MQSLPCACGTRAGEEIRESASLCPRSLRSLFLARIVRRVAIVDAARPDELHLHDRLLIAGPHKMRVLGRLCIEGPRLQHLAFRGVKLVARPEAHAPADDRDGLRIGMGVRWHLIIRRQLPPLTEEKSPLVVLLFPQCPGQYRGSGWSQVKPVRQARP